MIEVQHNLEMDRAFHNLRNSMLLANQYMLLLEKYKDRVLAPPKEKELLKELTGFLGHTPNIVFNADEVLENAYYKDVKLDSVDYKTVKCKNSTILKRQVIGMDFSSPFGSYLMIQHPVGYFTQNIQVPVLKQGNKVWMSPTISEMSSMKKGIDRGHGNCLTFGLGIGVLAYLWLLKDTVKSVTVIENNPDVIHIFKTFILPQFKTTKRLTIIEGDAFEYYTEEFMKDYDYTYVDFWENNHDGLSIYKKLMEKKIKNIDIDYWIEDSILYDVKFTIVPYLLNLYTGKEIYDYILSTRGTTREIAVKANRYFKACGKVISTEEELLGLIHSKEILREILAL